MTNNNLKTLRMAKNNDLKTDKRNILFNDSWTG
jgi:hypothetical protein